MIFVPIAVGLSIVLVVEILRWTLRPEARRLRMIKKIGGRR
jgi:cytochrome bd-type quinol oxidase subunit 1